LRKNEYTMDKGYNPTASAFRLCSWLGGILRSSNSITDCICLAECSLGTAGKDKSWSLNGGTLISLELSQWFCSAKDLQVKACVTWSWPLTSLVKVLAHIGLEPYNFEISGRVGHPGVNKLGWQSVSPSVVATKLLSSHSKWQDSADEQKPR
jgi:hypothetical protein